MKALLIALALFGTTVAAGTRHVLLYSEFSSGGPDDSSYVGIFDDGAILSWDGQADAPPASAQVLGSLAPSVIQGLRNRISGIPTTLILTDPSPQNASCNNTARNSLAVRKADGVHVQISLTAGCHTSSPEGTSIAEDLRRVIAGVVGFESLAH